MNIHVHRLEMKDIKWQGGEDVGEDWTKTILNHSKKRKTVKMPRHVSKGCEFQYATVRQNNFYNKGVCLLETWNPFFTQGVHDKLSQIFMQNNII